MIVHCIVKEEVTPRTIIGNPAKNHEVDGNFINMVSCCVLPLLRSQTVEYA